MRNSRRWLAHLLLVLALFIAQLGALTHALVHADVADAQTIANGDDNNSAPRGDPATSHKTDAFCALCSAFAAIGHGLTQQAHPIMPPQAKHAGVVVEVVACRSYLSFGFLSRAPPAATVA